MRLSPSRKSSRFVLGGSALLLAMSIYGSGTSSSLEGRVSEQGITVGRGTLHGMQDFGRAAVRARSAWRTMRANLRDTAATAPRTQTPSASSEELAFHSARLTSEHLEIAYALPSTGCISLWTTGAANQRFQRVSVIGGIPCSMATGDLSARLLLTSVQPALQPRQLIKLCTNNTLECTEPILISEGTSLSHSAAGTPVTIHSASIVRNSFLSVTYSKPAGCADLARWNGIGDDQQVTSENTTLSCDAVDHGSVQIGIMGMHPILGPTQWLHFCMHNDATACSNVIQVR